MKNGYNTFKEEIEGKTKDPSQGDPNTDIQEFNDFIEKINKINIVIDAHAENKTQLVNAAEDAYKKVKEALGGATPNRVVVRPPRLVNIVL
jgi:hypothetical protein